jgi:hypothetical protein
MPRPFLLSAAYLYWPINFSLALSIRPFSSRSAAAVASSCPGSDTAPICFIAPSRSYSVHSSTKLAILVEPVYLNAAHLNTISRASDAEELALVGSAYSVAAYHLVSFYYLVLYGVGEVGNSLAEVLDLALYGIRSSYLSGFAVWVPADEV